MTAKDIDRVKRKYEPLILQTMKSWADRARAAGWIADDPFEMTDDCYSWHTGWSYSADDKDGNPEFDISVTIAESGPYSGDRTPKGNSIGITIIMDVIAYGGQIVGGFSPYNYTPRVWTSDPEEIESRMQALAAITGEEILDSIYSWQRGR